MSVVSINVCGYFIYLYGCWVISSFFLSIHVSMAGVLYTMVSCILTAYYKYLIYQFLLQLMQRGHFQFALMQQSQTYSECALPNHPLQLL